MFYFLLFFLFKWSNRQGDIFDKIEFDKSWGFNNYNSQDTINLQPSLKKYLKMLNNAFDIKFKYFCPYNTVVSCTLVSFSLVLLCKHYCVTNHLINVKALSIFECLNNSRFYFQLFKFFFYLLAANGNDL